MSIPSAVEPPPNSCCVGKGGGTVRVTPVFRVVLHNMFCRLAFVTSHRLPGILKTNLHADHYNVFGD